MKKSRKQSGRYWKTSKDLQSQILELDESLGRSDHRLPGPGLSDLDQADVPTPFAPQTEARFGTWDPHE